MSKSPLIQPALLSWGAQESYRAVEVWPMRNKGPLYKHLQETLEELGLGRVRFKEQAGLSQHPLGCHFFVVQPPSPGKWSPTERRAEHSSLLSVLLGVGAGRGSESTYIHSCKAETEGQIHLLWTCHSARREEYGRKWDGPALALGNSCLNAGR